MECEGHRRRSPLPLRKSHAVVRVPLIYCHVTCYLTFLTLPPARIWECPSRNRTGEGGESREQTADSREQRAESSERHEARRSSPYEPWVFPVSSGSHRIAGGGFFLLSAFCSLPPPSRFPLSLATKSCNVKDCAPARAARLCRQSQRCILDLTRGTERSRRIGVSLRKEAR